MFSIDKAAAPCKSNTGQIRGITRPLPNISRPTKLTFMQQPGRSFELIIALCPTLNARSTLPILCLAQALCLSVGSPMHMSSKFNRLQELHMRARMDKRRDVLLVAFGPSARSFGSLRRAFPRTLDSHCCLLESSCRACLESSCRA